MDHSDNADRLSAEIQLDMFGAPPMPGNADADELRAELADILAEARAVPVDPWDVRDASYFRGAFSGMTEGLPAHELEQMRLELEAELARLEAVA